MNRRVTLKTFIVLSSSLPLILAGCNGGNGSKSSKSSFYEDAKKIVLRLNDAPELVNAGKKKSAVVKRADDSVSQEDLPNYQRHYQNDIGPDNMDGTTEYGNFYEFLSAKTYVTSFRKEMDTIIDSTETYNTWIGKSQGTKYRLNYIPSLSSLVYEMITKRGSVDQFTRYSAFVNEDDKLVFTQENFYNSPDQWWPGEYRFTYQKFRYVEDEKYEMFSFQWMMTGDVEFNKWYTCLDFNENVLKGYMFVPWCEYQDGKFVVDDEHKDQYSESYYEMDLNDENPYKIITHALHNTYSEEPYYSNPDEILEFRLYDEKMRNVTIRQGLSLFDFNGIENVDYKGPSVAEEEAITAVITLSNGSVIDTAQDTNFPMIKLNKYKGVNGVTQDRLYFHLDQEIQNKPTTLLKKLKDQYGIEPKYNVDEVYNRVKQGQKTAANHLKDEEYMTEFREICNSHMRSVYPEIFTDLAKDNNLEKANKDVEIMTLDQSITGTVGVNDNNLNFKNLSINLSESKVEEGQKFNVDLYLYNKWSTYYVASKSIDYDGKENSFALDFANVDLGKIEPTPGKYELKAFVRNYAANPLPTSLKGENISFTDKNGYEYSLLEDGTISINVKQTLA